jgi:hypothetical protein
MQAFVIVLKKQGLAEDTMVVDGVGKPWTANLLFPDENEAETFCDENNVDLDEWEILEVTVSISS